MKQENIIKICIEEARKSNYKQKIGAVIFKKKIIISQGYNSVVKSRKKLHPRYQKWFGSVHAEIDAIIKARTDLSKCSMMVIRVNNDDEFRLAKPCEFCLTYINHVGIKEVFYSTNDGFELIKF
jgi:deoxycytidylate deaminase